jgi:hypothetical protein
MTSSALRPSDAIAPTSVRRMPWRGAYKTTGWPFLERAYRWLMAVDTEHSSMNQSDDTFKLG